MPLSPQNNGIRWVPVTIMKSSGVDSMGQPSQVPEKYVDCFAQVVTLRAQEVPAAAQINPQINTKITVRYHDVQAAFEDGSLAKMFVLYKLQYYDIQGLFSRDQRDQWVDLLCIARIGQPPTFA